MKRYRYNRRNNQFHFKRESLWKRIDWEVKAILIMIIIGIVSISLKAGRFAIDLWIIRYLNYFKLISGYFSGWSFALFGWHFFFVYLFSEIWYTLLTLFILIFLLKLIFGKE